MKHLKKILVIGMGALMMGAALTGCATKFKQQEVAAQVSQAKLAQSQADQAAVAAAQEQAKIAIDSAQKAFEQGKASVVIPPAQDVSAKDAEIARLNAVLEDAKAAQAAVDAETAVNGYLLDDLQIGAEFNKTMSDRELAVMDSTIRFDGDNYNAEEIVYLKAKPAVDETDFAGKSFLQVKEEGLTYSLVLDADLDTSKITTDKTLKIKILGQDSVISNWDTDKVTFSSGNKKTLKIGESVVVDGKTISLINVGSDKAVVQIGDEVEAIKEGDSYVFNDETEVLADTVVDNDDGADFAILKIGKDVLKEVKDGDDYADDSVWTWSISANSIGLKLNEDFVSLNDDFKPLAYGEKLSLPNDYIVVSYKGLTDEKMYGISFDLTEKNGKSVVQARGDFTKGVEDYTKVFINSTGIYDKDLKSIGTSVDIDGTKLDLTTDGTYVVVDNVKLPYVLDKVLVGGVDKSGYDEDYLTTYGIKISNPDNAVEDVKWKVEIPADELKAEITVTPKAK